MLEGVTRRLFHLRGGVGRGGVRSRAGGWFSCAMPRLHYRPMFFCCLAVFLLVTLILYAGEEQPSRAEATGLVRNWNHRDVNDGSLADLIVGVNSRSDHGGRRCKDCRDLFKGLRPACPTCRNLSMTDIKLAHPSVFSRTGVDCPALFQGDSSVVEKAKEYMRTHQREKSLAQDLIDSSKDCAEFRQRRGYFTQPTSEEEADFSIAFSILVYDDVQQVERLLRAVYAPQNAYCIHVDSKADESVKRALRSLAGCFDNVFIASRLHSVFWGHISIIYAEMSCMEDLLQFSTTWKYFINLSGQMFPAHTNRELVKILKLYNGSNDVEGSVKRADHIWLSIRYKLSWHFSSWLGSMVFLPYFKDPPPYNMTIYKGSNQMAVTRQFVLYFLYHPWSQHIVEYFVDTLAPDEFIWPTLNHNPHLHVPGSYKGDPETKTFTARASIWKWYSYQVNWSWKPWTCRGKWVREICIFGVGDLPWLHQRPELFVNKFHSDFEPLTYDCLEELIFNRTMNESLENFDRNYYLNLSFVNNSTLVVSLNETREFLSSTDF